MPNSDFPANGIGLKYFTTKFLPCKRTVPITKAFTSAIKRKSISKLGYIKMGTVVNDTFNSLKNLTHSVSKQKEILF